MKGARYTAEFKAEALKQFTERGHGVVELAKRLGVLDKSLNMWLGEADLHKCLMQQMELLMSMFLYQTVKQQYNMTKS